MLSGPVCGLRRKVGQGETLGWGGLGGVAVSEGRPGTVRNRDNKFSY